MKKILLFAAAIVMAVSAQAQNYTAQASTETDPDWTDYDGNVLLDQPVTVEAYDDYVIIKGWLGTDKQDIKVAFDEDEGVTGLTPITEGVEGKTYASGYASFSTKASNYYYVQLYLGDGYDYAYSDDEGGYVLLSGYFYPNQDTYYWMYYYIAWDNSGEVELGELKYTTKAKTGVFDDWGSADKFFAPGTEVGVDVYENGIMLNGWCGAEGYDLVIQYNDEATVTSIAAIEDNEAGTIATAGDYLAAYTGNASLYYVNIYVAEGYNYAYTGADDNYVLLSGTFYDADNEEHALYYYISWEEKAEGIHAIATEAPAQYFNLQGQPVANPAKGQILIKRQGDSATKTLVR